MDGSGDGKATLNDVWHKLGKIESDIEQALKRIEPIEHFARNYAADRNRILGAVAAVAALAVFVVSGIKQWIASLVNPS